MEPGHGPHRARPSFVNKETPMLWTIFVVLLVLWLLGMATSTTLGGFIHILLLLAIASVLIRLIQGRSVV
jgi:ABC-type multidrug transport system permease subunit